MPSQDSPGPFQKKLCWAALSSLSALAIVLVAGLAGWGVILACGYMKPVLTPVAIAAVLAYLLTPLVGLLCRWRVPRTWSVVIVFLLFVSGLVLIGITVAPSLEHQGSLFASKIPSYSQSIANLARDTASEFQRLEALRSQQPERHSPIEDFSPENMKLYGVEVASKAIAWLQAKLPEIASNAGLFLQKSIGGVFGILGFLLSLILVPVFLFFFLIESPRIASNWSRYLPLRASPLKEEIVSLFNEINDYLIHFFRGQLLVSLIDGAIVGIALFAFVRLDFSFLIGLMLGILCLIPYFGFFVCLVPAMLIALAQFGDLYHPAIVLIIFTASNWLEGIFISPKIVGSSVGLHPMTVILSVLAWTILLGGLLGALLAIPLTATLKVLLRRYFWDRPTPVPIQQSLGIAEQVTPVSPVTKPALPKDPELPL